mgnify:FL=1
MRIFVGQHHVNEGYCDGCGTHVWDTTLAMIDGDEDAGSIHFCPSCWSEFQHLVLRCPPPEKGAEP